MQRLPDIDGDPVCLRMGQDEDGPYSLRIILPCETRPTPSPHTAWMCVVEGCTDCRRRREPCRRCSLGHTTGLAPLRPDTPFHRGRTGRGAHLLFGPSSTLQLTSSPLLSPKLGRECQIALQGVSAVLGSTSRLAIGGCGTSQLTVRPSLGSRAAI